MLLGRVIRSPVISTARRTLSSSARLQNDPILPPPELARLASTPHKVRERRAKQGIPEAMASSGVTEVQQVAYDKQAARGEILASKSGRRPPAPREWLARRLKWRSRIRGRVLVPQLPKDHPARRTEVEEKYSYLDIQRTEKDWLGVGRKVYLPNIIFRLVPNKTPAGQPYNPFEATFRIPLSVTKTDVRSYLWAMYGLPVTYIRTDVYYAPIERQMRRHKARHNSKKTYKRAVVGLTQPFMFPEMMEDLPRVDREARQKYLEDTFHLETIATDRRDGQRQSLGLEKGWNQRVTGKKNVMRARQERMAQMEQTLNDAVREMLQSADGSKELVHRDDIPVPKD